MLCMDLFLITSRVFTTPSKRIFNGKNVQQLKQTETWTQTHIGIDRERQTASQTDRQTDRRRQRLRRSYENEPMLRHVCLLTTDKEQERTSAWISAWISEPPASRLISNCDNDEVLLKGKDHRTSRQVG